MIIKLDTTLTVGLDHYRLVPGRNCRECPFFSEEAMLCPVSKAGRKLCEGVPNRIWQRVPLSFREAEHIHPDDQARVVCMNVCKNQCSDPSQCPECENSFRLQLNRQLREMCGWGASSGEAERAALIPDSNPKQHEV